MRVALKLAVLENGVFAVFPFGAVDPSADLSDPSIAIEHLFHHLIVRPNLEVWALHERRGPIAR